MTLLLSLARTSKTIWPGFTSNPSAGWRISTVGGGSSLTLRLRLSKVNCLPPAVAMGWIVINSMPSGTGNSSPVYPARSVVVSTTTPLTVNSRDSTWMSPVVCIFINRVRPWVISTPPVGELNSTSGEPSLFNLMLPVTIIGSVFELALLVTITCSVFKLTLTVTGPPSWPSLPVPGILPDIIFRCRATVFCTNTSLSPVAFLAVSINRFCSAKSTCIRSLLSLPAFRDLPCSLFRNFSSRLSMSIGLAKPFILGLSPDFPPNWRITIRLSPILMSSLTAPPTLNSWSLESNSLRIPFPLFSVITTRLCCRVALAGMIVIFSPVTRPLTGIPSANTTTRLGGSVNKPPMPTFSSGGE